MCTSTAYIEGCVCCGISFDPPRYYWVNERCPEAADLKLADIWKCPQWNESEEVTVEWDARGPCLGCKMANRWQLGSLAELVQDAESRRHRITVTDVGRKNNKELDFSERFGTGTGEKDDAPATKDRSVS